MVYSSICFIRFYSVAEYGWYTQGNLFVFFIFCSHTIKGTFN